ncbi:MAG: hypothetical protein KDI31_08015, partial [Pseudomonadales bacterium]|nr:hypothetical protein [Pseudomonadales bacterium]
NSMVMGAPGKVVRQLTEAEVAGLTLSAKHYAEKAERFRNGLSLQAEVDPEDAAGAETDRP